MAAKKRQTAPTKGAVNPPGQQSLPKKFSGDELTTELCTLEVQLRKRKTDLEKAHASLELAKAAVKTAEQEVDKTQDAIAEALYDLRQGQGRIVFKAAAEQVA